MWIVDAASVLPDVAPSATLVLLDTEGLGSYQKTETHDVKIFSLAILLSSFFIYNSLTTIDDNAMDRLSYPLIRTALLMGLIVCDVMCVVHSARLCFP